MLDWLDSIPNLSVPGVPGVQPQISAGLRGTPERMGGVPGVPEHLRGNTGTPAGTPASNSKLLNYNRSHPEHRQHPNNSSQTLKDWRSSLHRVSLDRAHHGLARARWGQLIDDADWLLEHFGQQVAGDGWSALDLFGVLPGRDAWGGIADRLRSSRSLVMATDRAMWRRVVNGAPESFARGLGETVRMVPLWQTE